MNCRSCGAEILWGRTPTGKPVPLDAKGDNRYIVTGTDDEDDMIVEIRKTYGSHFATCPQAAAWRKTGAI